MALRAPLVHWLSGWRLEAVAYLPLFLGTWGDLDGDIEFRADRLRRRPEVEPRYGGRRGLEDADACLRIHQVDAEFSRLAGEAFEITHGGVFPIRGPGEGNLVAAQLGGISERLFSNRRETHGDEMPGACGLVIEHEEVVVVDIGLDRLFAKIYE